MLFQGKQYLPYAVGDKIYGGGRDAPNIGPVNPLGYRDRDLKYQARRTALLRRLQSVQSGDYASADAQRSI
jgi:hypothetical protein